MFIFSFFSFREFSLPALANRALAIILCAAAFTFPHSARADSPPALLLAQNYAGGVDLGGRRIIKKKNGVRARWDGANLISRNGNRFAAPAWFTANFPAAKLDGELWMGRGRFEQTVSVVRRAAPHDGWREVRFMVFDMPRAGGDFNARLRRMKTTVAAAAQRNRHIALVEQFTVRDHRALVERMREVAAAGGEGLMLHRGGAFYRSGRSRDLLKLKPFDDAEATVIAHHRGRGKFSEVMGAMTVELADGTRFRIGTGFTNAQRKTPPPPGAVVTFKHQGWTGTGKPRFPVFWRVREEE
ncbi:MAG: DNA ligase [Gammaproteobacteria bacterium]|nr:DNA ligase [Gammaproteobacteria bacterium]